MKITVYLNEGRGHFLGYEPGHSVREVFQFELAGQLVPELAAEHAYYLFNIDPDQAGPVVGQIVDRYRAAGNRSLSVGDVLRIDDTWWAVARIDFTQLDTAPSIVDDGVEPEDAT